MIKTFSERSLRTSDNTSQPKVNDLRKQVLIQEDPEDPEEDEAHKLMMEKKGWSYFFQRNSVLRTYQKRLVFNSDVKVAALEFAIMLLSLAQLQWSYRSPHWRENRACAARTSCIDSLSDGSFAVANVIRSVIAILAIARLSIRLHQLWKTKHPGEQNLPWFKLLRVQQYALELLYTAVFPYPGLESFLPGDLGNVFVTLSVSVLFRTTSWGQWLYYPFPIRQKEKVASFSGNLEFSYRQFVIKKVLDDTPLNKVVFFYTMVGAIAAYLLHMLETIMGECSWKVVNPNLEVRSEDAVCYELPISDALWMIFMTFLSIGYGDVSPKTSRGRSIVAITACVALLLDAIFFSIVIRNFTFSTMEARVHAFLYRMELLTKKDISAVLAVQATFRYNKSYKQSLIWHQQRGSNIFYRPLSARLPNEVKKKLYVSRFQMSLKQIMKYNTDGDPLNAFSKHVEVITAALGATFLDMIRLRKMYYRRVRVLDQRKQQTIRRASSFRISSSGRPLLAFAGDEKRALLKTRKPDLITVGKKSASPADQDTKNAAPSGVSAAWGDEMQRKCDATMALLKRIETNVKSMPQTRSW